MHFRFEAVSMKSAEMEQGLLCRPDVSQMLIELTVNYQVFSSNVSVNVVYIYFIKLH